MIVLNDKDMAIYSEKLIHSDEKRHKCHFCGAVRYEGFMIKLKSYEVNACSQFGNDLKCWACKSCYKQYLRQRENKYNKYK